VIEKTGRKIIAYECKWKDVATVPRVFKAAYPDADFQCITTNNITAHFVNEN